MHFHYFLNGYSLISINYFSEERKWRKWADDILVHTLSPNVYRTREEALQAFNWFSEVGEWDKHFPAWERYIMVYVGAYAMWLISKRLKKRFICSYILCTIYLIAACYFTYKWLPKEIIYYSMYVLFYLFLNFLFTIYVSLSCKKSPTQNCCLFCLNFLHINFFINPTKSILLFTSLNFRYSPCLS